MKNILFSLPVVATTALSASLTLCGVAGASPEPAPAPVMAASSTSSTITVAVQPENQQIIKEWGFATQNRGDWNATSTIVNYPQSMAALYGDSGATIVRFHIDYRVASSAKSRQALKEGILAATSRGMKWYGLPWSPPTYMKTINDPDGRVSGQINRLKDGYEDEVAQWLVDLVKGLKDEGVPLPVAIGPQNEPDFGPPGYPGCVYTTSQMRRVIIELRNRLDAAGLSGVAVMGNDGAKPDSYDSNTGTIQQLGLPYPGGFFHNNTNYRNSLGIISTHTYDLHNGLYTNKPGYMQSWYDLTLQANKPVWMTEWEARHEHAQSDWEVLSETFAHFNRDVSSMRFEAWFSWQVWRSSLFNANEPFTNDNQHGKWVWDDGTTLQKRPLFYAFRRVWKNAPAGQTYVRRVVSSDNNALQGESKAPDPKSYRQDLSAFRTGTRTTVVLLNRDDSVTKTVRVTGLRDSSARIYRYVEGDASSTNRDMRLIRTVGVTNGQTDTFTLLPKSLNILITD